MNWINSITSVIAATGCFVLVILELRRYWKLSKPKLIIEFDNGSLVKHNKSWRIKYLGLRITVPIDRPPISIEKVQYPIRDLRNGTVLNRPSQDSYLHLFPLRGTKENWEVKRIIQPGEACLCCVPDILTGVYQDGEYELVLRIKCKAGQKDIETSSSRKFIVKGETAQWNTW